ncbi:uncharacterized protein LOC133909019 [Phragmites australis]|uniref:uncharacterized protein LOC133909019 n=1 Tax=Phragmites australis TaxID=29695 RepID=UPI002D7701DE|nr:uncharacterized protein LOC133909019 [Phragmites australis]XP_062207270.1 uncharacterized protein LOC133909019 [Phragmites australis]XP_062207271.1 uncharacterized protein LOC133909019 [Phragmites australis]
MQSAEVKGRFGRCPYCRAMIYQDPNAVIFYCSKCRTPIRGKNPRPTDETEYALSQLEILSADTASVFSDDVEPSNSNPRPAWIVEDGDDEQPPVQSKSTPYGNFKSSSCQGTGALSSSPYKGFGSVRTGSRSNREEEKTGSPMHSRVTELRPSSRRTRRSMSGDVDVPNSGGSGTDSESDVPASAASYRRRASPLSSQELEAETVLSGFEPANVARSPLTDPAFTQGLLQALDNLRRVIAVVEQPYSVDGHEYTPQTGMSRMSSPCNDGSGGTRTITRRSSRLMRRLESQLAQALPADQPRRDESTSSSSLASSSRRDGLRARTHHCRPVLGGTPFVLCDKCSEILQLPAALPVGKVTRLQCGGCGEALALMLPASGSMNRPKKIFSAPQPAVCGAEDTEEYALARRSNLSSEQPRPAGPLHRVLGYSSVSSVFRSRRYGEHD